MGLTLRAAVVLIFLTLVFVDVHARCPPASQVRGPECREDYNCHKGPCCPNWLGKKSCVSTVSFTGSIHTTDKYFGRHENTHDKNNNYGSGVYCDGVKCMPYQVCKADRFTGKLRCQAP